MDKKQKDTKGAMKMEETKINVPDDLVVQMHTKQLLSELERRVLRAHFRFDTFDSKFTEIVLKVPNTVWRRRHEA